MLTLLKFLSISAVILAYIATSFPGHVLLRGNMRLRYCSRITSFYCGIALRILGVTVSVTNKEKFPCKRNVMFVSNHLSYLDILIIAAQKPTLFITSIEVKHTFFLGLMSTLGGSLFVERRSVSGVRKDINKIAGLLADGFNICFFPEATSTNGSEVLPFKSSFFEAAKKAEITIIPLCIRYPFINNRPADESNLDYVCFYGDMTFFPHFVKLMPLKLIEAELIVTDKIVPWRYSRKEMAEVSFNRVLEAYFA